MSKRTCSIDECERPHSGRGWCQMHLKRWARTGDPMGDPNIFTNAEDAFAARTARDPSTGCLVWTGGKFAYGYGSIWADGRNQYAHRYIWERVNGALPDGVFLDHICRNPSCAEISHLRPATPAENSWNRSSSEGHGSTGVLNVHRTSRGFEVSIKRHGKYHSGGVFNSIEVAAIAARKLRIELFGDFAGALPAMKNEENS